MLRAALSERQLEEVLVDFWFNHFNVFVGKGQVRAVPDRVRARRHPSERARQLPRRCSARPRTARRCCSISTTSRAARRTLPVGASTRRCSAGSSDPRLCTRAAAAARCSGMREMRSRAAAAPAARPERELRARADGAAHARRRRRLHAEGRHRGRDASSPGWTIDRPQQGGGFVFRPQMHDAGEKMVLGAEVHGGRRQEEGERLLDMLAKHPATAQAHLVQAGAALRRRRAAAGARRSRGEEVPRHEGRPARSDARHHHVAGVLRRRRVLGQGEDAARVRRLGGARDRTRPS